MIVIIKRLLLLVFSFTVLTATAQQSAYNAYIQRYKDMAVEQMFKYGIPASITLAQGLLESAAGQSTLARKANNHFGIKVGSSWKGAYMLRDDDAPNEKFRAYGSVEESYEDHSLFLRNNRRYAALFTLLPDDYKGWAKGLKKAGYATAPTYASSLIRIIESYNLHHFDKHTRSSWKKSKARDYDHAETKHVPTAEHRQVYKCNGNFYVIAQAGDTYETIGRWADVKARKLRRYNEVPRKARLKAGDIVYLEKKRSKAARALKGHVHTVKAGESLHSISQTYGMRMKKLYKLNNLPEDYSVRTGERLRIR